MGSNPRNFQPTRGKRADEDIPMNTRKFDATLVEDIKTHIAEWPQRKTLRPFDVIAQLAETIQSAKGRGYDIDDIMAILQKWDINLARSTVRTYLSRALAMQAQHGTQTAAARRPEEPATVTPLRAIGAIEPVRPNAAAASSKSLHTSGSFKVRPDTVDI